MKLSPSGSSDSCMQSIQSHKSDWPKWINQHDNYNSLIPLGPPLWKDERGEKWWMRESNKNMRKKGTLPKWQTQELSLNKREASIIKTEGRDCELTELHIEHGISAMEKSRPEQRQTEADHKSILSHDTLHSHCLKTQREAELSSVLIHMFCRDWERQFGMNT